MKIVLGMSCYNDLLHLEKKLKVDLDGDYYDEIVILDDGSTDGTWDVLNDYASKFKNIHIHKNKVNSVLSHGQNRWRTLYDLIVPLGPQWIGLGAADTIYSYPARKLLRPQLEKFMKIEANVVMFPYIHLWRSEGWYRSNGKWGRNALIPCIRMIYRYSKKASWSADYSKSGMHQNMGCPTDFGLGKIKTIGINDGLDKDYIVVLHYAHTTHQKIVDKFGWYLEASKTVQRSRMPKPENMPPVKDWARYNAYTSAFEFDIQLERVKDHWYGPDGVPSSDRPKIESLYGIVKEYNEKRAEEYKTLFEKTFNN